MRKPLVQLQLLKTTGAYCQSVLTHLLCFLCKFQYLIYSFKKKVGPCFAHKIFLKIRIIFVASVVFFPCFVEAATSKITKMTPEFSYGLFLSNEFISQDAIKHMNELGIPFLDVSNGFIECSYQFFPGCNLSFFSGMPPVEKSFTDGNRNSDRPNNYSSYDWCFYYSTLFLALYSVWLSMQTVNRNTRRIISNLKHNI